VKALEQVLDIGPKYAAQFQSAGIRTVYELANSRDLQELSVRSEIPLEMVTQWRQQAESKIKAYGYRRKVLIAISLAAFLIIGSIFAVYVAPNKLYARAIALNNGGNYKDAVWLYDLVILLNPKFQLAYANKGGALSNLGRNDDALAALDRAIELNPNDFWAYGERAGVYMSLQKYDEAIADCDEAIKLNANDQSAYANKGMALRANGDYAQAVDALSQALNIDSHYAWAYAERGAIFHDNLFKYQLAYEDLKSATEETPKSVDYSADFAEAALTWGQYSEAYTISAGILDGPNGSKLEVPVGVACRFIVISALLLEGNKAQAKQRLEEFIGYYKTVQNSFQHNWNFAGTRNYIEQQPMDISSRNTILSLTDLLGKQPSGNIDQIEKLASTLK
jgi:tetratricopeptide (TPR) repeat protein